MLSVVLLILLLPLVAFLLVIFIGKRLPRGGDWVSLWAIWSGLGLSLYLFVDQALNPLNPEISHTWSWEWLRWGNYTLRVGIHLDVMALVMLVVVTLVSSLVHLYSVGYMAGDPKYSRFFAFLSFFSFSMLGLVLADNLLVIFCFWELVGLSSYLLIGFWHERPSAAIAAKKAFVVNRVGDAGMLLGMLLVFSTIGTLNLQGIYQGVSEGQLKGDLLTAAGLLLFMGAVGKSAQFPLHIWLPDAMEGPTPVSALIHAATMVAAGVYLTARLFPILTPEASLVIAYVGGFTALFSATIALAQNDIKRVLAYSTVSQLGYMIMALGVGSYTAGFFHLVTHAMFKACLFLGSGSVIHSLHHAFHHAKVHQDAQDIRNMGGLKTYLPKTFWTFLVATLALSGIPLTSGFLSKDAILGGTLHFVREHPQHWLLALFGFGGAGLTAFYMFRLVWLVFGGDFRGGEEAKHYLHESPSVMTTPLMVLSLLCFFLFFTYPSLNFVSYEAGWFGHLMIEPGRAYASLEGAHHSSPSHHSSHLWAMVLSLAVASMGIFLATRAYLYGLINVEHWRRRFGLLYQGMYRKWWVDELYQMTVVKGTLRLAQGGANLDLRVIDGVVDGSAFLTRTYAFLQGLFDNVVIDGWVNLTAQVVGIWGRMMRFFQGGQVQRYILYTLIGIGIVLLAIL